MHSVTSSTVTDLQAKVKYLEELDKGQKEEVSSSYVCMHQIVYWIVIVMSYLSNITIQEEHKTNY
jgi:hypothetical protein